MPYLFILIKIYSLPVLFYHYIPVFQFVNIFRHSPHFKKTKTPPLRTAFNKVNCFLLIH